MSVEPIKLKTQILLRNDAAGNIGGGTKIILGKGEPFYATDMYIDGTHRNVLFIGDGENSINNLLSDDSNFFFAGKGAGYVLERATAYQLGGVQIPENLGLKINNSGEIWITPGKIAGKNLKYRSVGSYPEFGLLDVDLDSYTGDISINGNVDITGTITANLIEFQPSTVANQLELRATTGETSPNPLTGVAGIYVYNISGTPEDNQDVVFGTDSKGQFVFRNPTANYLVPLIKESDIKEIPLLRMNNKGIIGEAAIAPLTIKTRTNTGSDWTSTTINITDTEKTVELTIPRKLSDLEDYSDSTSGPSYVSGEDRKLWNQTITDVAIDSNTTIPYLTDTIYDEDDGSKRTTKKLFLPQANVTPGAGIQIMAGGVISLAPVKVSRPDIEPLLSPPQITYISNIEVDEYGRVTKIEKITATIA